MPPAVVDVELSMARVHVRFRVDVIEERRTLASLFPNVEDS